MKIVIFYDCDEWKSRSSMRFICAARAEKEKEVFKSIRDEHEYTEAEAETYIYIEHTELL